MRLRVFTKDETPDKPPWEKPAKAEAAPRLPSLTTYWLSAIFGMAVLMLAAISAGVFVWMEHEEAVRLQHLESCGTMTLSALEKQVTKLQELLRGWEEDPRMRAAFRAKNLDDLQAAVSALAQRAPDESRLTLVKSGAGGSDDLYTESLSYAGRDLVQQAKHGRGTTLLEVHRLGNPDVHLAIAGPVFDEQRETVLGVVHLALPTSQLPSTSDGGGGWGRLGFLQTVAGKDVILPLTDGVAPPSAMPNLQVAVAGTSLKVAGWVGSEVLDGKLMLGAGATYLAVVTLLGLVMWLPMRHLRRALILDYGGVVSLVDDVLSGKSAPTPQCRLAETKPVIKVLTSLLGRLQPVARHGRKTEEKGKNRLQKGGADEGTSMGSGEAGPVVQMRSVPIRIFRTYDIRGIVDGELTADLVHALGLAIGTEVKEAGDQTVVVGRDTRTSSESFSTSLVQGLRESGRDVLDLGMVPTPLIYFATRNKGETSGVMITASCNPAGHNGLKVVVGGDILAGEKLMGLRQRILAGSFSRGSGSYRAGDLIDDYIGTVQKNVAIARALKVVVDCGNATASLVAPRLYKALDCNLVELACDAGAGFSVGRAPDPTRPECLEELQSAVLAQGADLGLAFDADGDRLGIVDSSGKIIWPDRVLMLLAADVLSRHPGSDVIFDVKSSRHLASEILRNGGRPIMWKSGPVPLKAKLRETGALLAGEWRGHILFQERWFGFDDALYAGARLLEVLALDPRPTAEVFAALPEAVSTPELLLPLPEGEAENIMQAVLEQSRQLRGVDLRTEHGLRVESAQGWGLAQASDTQAALLFRFEADDDTGLAQIQDLFRRILEQVAPQHHLPF